MMPSTPCGPDRYQVPTSTVVVAYLQAFSTRLATTCASRSGSAATDGARHGTPSSTGSWTAIAQAQSLGGRGEPLRRLAHDLPQVGRPHLQGEGAGVELGQVEQVAHEAFEPARLGGDDPGRLGRVGRRPVAHRLGEPPDGVSGVRRSCDTESRNWRSCPRSRSRLSAMALIDARERGDLGVGAGESFGRREVRSPSAMRPAARSTATSGLVMRRARVSATPKAITRITAPGEQEIQDRPAVGGRPLGHDDGQLLRASRRQVERRGRVRGRAVEPATEPPSASADDDDVGCAEAGRAARRSPARRRRRRRA